MESSKIEKKDFENQESEIPSKAVLKSCCGWTTDRRLLVIIFQMLISFTMVIFSVTQMITAEDSCDAEKYNSILLTVIGFWFGKKV